MTQNTKYFPKTHAESSRLFIQTLVAFLLSFSKTFSTIQNLLHYNLINNTPFSKPPEHLLPVQSLKLVVENFSLKWKEIHFLFTLVYNFQCLNNTSLGYIKQYNFHYMILGYTVDGVEYECYINLRQTKYRLVFYQSKSGRPNPHALIKVCVGVKSAVSEILIKFKCVFKSQAGILIICKYCTIFIVRCKLNLNDLVPN